MAVVTGTLAAERWMDIVIINGTKANSDGDVVDYLTLPAGIGDVAIMELMVRAGPVATAVALTNLALEAHIAHPSGLKDLIGVEPWYATSATERAAYLSPDPLVLWRQGELLQIVFPELDSNASPTVDFNFDVKCVRVRPQEDEGGGSIHLVR